jgi:hypothetical protein
MTVLFIRANRISPLGKDKGVEHSRRRLPFVINLVLDLCCVFDHEHEHEQEHEIDRMRACMSAAVIDYALCGCGRSPKNEDRVGR